MGYKFSVVIPVYNGQNFIARAIESVLAQTYPAFEVVVINDGSKDATENILKGFGSRIRFKTISNGGVSNARNEGIKIATGDFVAFLDADDIWHKDKLAVHNELFTRFPSAGFSCCNYVVFNPNLQREVEHFDVLKGYPVQYDALMSGDDAFKLLLALNFVGTASTAVMKKDVLNTVGFFNTSYRQAEDYELWLRAAMVTGFVITRRVLVEKKTHATNLTNDQFEMNSYHKTVLMEFRKTHETFIREHDLERSFDEAIADVHFKLGNISYNLGKVWESVGFYWKSYSYCKSPRNFIRFFVGVVKKAIRFLSFGLITRTRG